MLIGYVYLGDTELQTWHGDTPAANSAAEFEPILKLLALDRKRYVKKNGTVV